MSNRASKITKIVALGQLVLGSLAMLPAAAHEPAVRPHIDLAFCIDTTGSMQNEIDSVKAKTREIVARLAGGKPSPVIRVGLVAYRDRGDEYVTKVFPFTQDIDKVVKTISSLKADGGGDTPESVNEGLHVAVNDLHWDDSSKTVKLLFLIGDAGPNSYPQDYDWKDESKKAITKGIQINTFGCNGLENDGEGGSVKVFKEIARLADGKYQPLAYRQQVVAADGHKETLISSGGSTYRLADKAAASWKTGASALTASGAAVLVAPAAVMSRVRADGPTDRKENNLADLVLEATKKAANEKLKLEFKD